MNSFLVLLFMLISLPAYSQVGKDDFYEDGISNSTFTSPVNSFEDPDNVFVNSTNAENRLEKLTIMNSPGNPGDPVPIDDHLLVLLFLGIVLIIYFSCSTEANP